MDGKNKKTTDLENELSASESFESFAEKNASEFLSSDTEASENEKKECPFCQARLLHDAAYCYVCMKPLSERRVIARKKSRISRIARTLIAISALIAAIAIGVFIGSLFQKKDLQTNFSLPSPSEFRSLIYNATDEDTRDFWALETLTYQKDDADCILYGNGDAGGSTVTAAFSLDKRRLLFAVASPSGKNDLDMVYRLENAAFSAVCRYYAEGLEEHLAEDSFYARIGFPDDSVSAYLKTAGIDLSKGAEVLSSPPIIADRYEDDLKIYALKIISGDKTYFLLWFESGEV